ncbi:hypothetical protein ACGRHY_24870 [Streptomyces sp. HK10]|uniref:hypothetical protein n=1 Tax=Streptomyces sp. HK10 TaxID=3373255 RepID=UPI0037478EBD
MTIRVAVVGAGMSGLSASSQEAGATAPDHAGGSGFPGLDRGLDHGAADCEPSEAEVAGRSPSDSLPLRRDAERFHREAPRDFPHERTGTPLGECPDRNGYGGAFRYGRVVLLATVVRPAPAELI